MQMAVNTLLLFLLRYLSRDSYRDTIGNNLDIFFIFICLCCGTRARVAENGVPFDGPARH